MGVEIDPVILQLRADVNKYLADLRSTTTKVDKLLDQQVASARNLEREMRRSSAAISGHLKGLAASIAGYFTGRELVGLLDNFTRLQNQLKVAGLEGARLKSVQDALFVSAQKYGVSINALAELYSKASQSGKELGATDAQLLKLTEATAQALLITGTSTEQASGAILGLSQALASGTVHAEEFNQINEGGLRPLLQAAAASERFGGSVAKLRQEVIAGKVSSQELYNAIQQNAKLLEGQAAKATLTLSGGFTVLTNALTKYFGEADKANGVSAALGEAMHALADNLDTLIPAIALVATALGVRYVVGATAAIGATVLASNAMFALQARMLGAATTAEALGFALGGMKLGLVSVAVLALGGAIYYAHTQIEGAADATGAYAKAQEEAKKASEGAARAADNLANAHGKAREQALALARAEAENVKQKLASARASVVLAQAELARAKVRLSTLVDDNPAGAFAPALGDFGPGYGNAVVGGKGVKVAEANLKAAKDSVATLEAGLDSVMSRINGAAAPAVAAGGKKTKGHKGRSGPSAAEIEQRFQDERVNLGQQALSAQESMAKSAEERAEYELRGVELARIRTEADIKHNKDYTAEQKKILTEQVERLAELERERIDFDKKRQIEQEAQQLADEQYNSQRDALQIQYDLADSQSERKRLALEILDAEQKHLRSVLDAIIASETATEADKERAKVARDGLDAIAAGQRTRAVQQNETQRDRYLRELNKSPEAINEAIDGIKIDGLDALNNGLVEAIQGTKSLGDVFKDVANQIIADLLRIAIQRAIIQPLANAIFGAGAAALGGGAGAGITVTRGGSIPLPGRASGGRVNAGQMYRVNEASPIGKVEGFRPDSSGDIIPLGRMNAPAMGLQQSGNARVQIELSGDIDGRIARVSGPVAVEIVRSAAPSIIDASAREAFARGRRPSL